MNKLKKIDESKTMEQEEIREILKQEMVTPNIIDEFLCLYGDYFEDFEDADYVLDFFWDEYSEDQVDSDWGWGNFLSE